MSVTTHRIRATPERVFDVLANGWLYSGWVVGTSTIRAVEDTWPAPGSKIFHAVGAWPVMVKDETQVLESVPGKRLVLQARGWPMGEARVEVDLEAEGDGCRATITETPSRGPALLMRNPAGELLLHQRNIESLRRLASLAERHDVPAS